MNLVKIVKNLWKFALKNYFISIFFACIVFVAVVAGYKLFFSKSTYVYARVKVGQGLWWASTSQPPVWFINSIKPGEIQADLLGKPLVEILSVRHYPSFISTNQYNVYLDLRLKVTGMKGTGTYNFNRSSIGVGSGIDLEFPQNQFSGTITDLSEKPFEDKYIEKTVYLNRPDAAPWEYDAIKIGDKYFDGKNIVFQILDKSSFDVQGLVAGVNTQPLKNITVKVNVLVKNVNGQYVYGEEQIVAPGKIFYVSTQGFSFNNFLISKVE